MLHHLLPSQGIVLSLVANDFERCCSHITHPFIFINWERAGRGGVGGRRVVCEHCCCFQIASDNIKVLKMSCSRLLNPHFIGVVVVILLNWFVFTFMFMLDLKPKPYIVFLIIFHVFFILLVWSMARSILSDPGRVPIYWGFFAEEAENRKRRYCLLCHSFKPERCHHCSTCQRCVLNMDHHCPWIANCVGFSNRKYFMLFLFYIILTVVFSLCIEIPLLVEQVIQLINGDIGISAPFILRALAVLFKIAFFFAIILFFKFHVELVLENSSTLDNLERQRNPNAGPNVYDIGAYENFVQVFGTNTCMWPIPVAPVFANRANGVIWPKNQ